MSKSYFLGLDVGTSGAKALVVSKDGHIVGRGHSAYGLSTSANGRVEQDAKEWLDAIALVVRQASADIDARDIVSVSVSSQGGTMVPVSQEGRPLAPAISWLDRGAVAEAEVLRNLIGEDEVFHLTGWPIAPNNTAVQIAAYRARCPQDFSRARYFLETASFVNMWLSGAPVIDTNVAGISQLTNVVTKTWEPRILEALGIDAARLPAIVEPGTPIGPLTPSSAMSLGLDPMTRVIAGGHDQYCAALGAGILDAASMLVSTGTAWVVLATSDKPYASAADGFGNGRHLVHDLWGHFGEVFNGGVSLEWIRHVLSGTGSLSFDDLNRLAASVSPGARSARFFPYFNGTNPHDPLGASQAAFRGLQLSHGPGDLVRSVMEGVVFEAVLLIRRYERTVGQQFRPTVVGGATKSPTWIRIFADTLGRDIQSSPVADAACLGAAVLARRGVEPSRTWGAITSLMVPPSTTIEFDPENNKTYSKILEEFEREATSAVDTLRSAPRLS